jgi:hypothetical protein
MRQGDYHLVHLVNLSGHSQTAYFKAVPMSGIQVQVKGAFSAAKAIRSSQDLALSRQGEYSSFTLPSLIEYEMVELR